MLFGDWANWGKVLRQLWETGVFFAVVNLLAQHSSASKVLRSAVQTSRSQDAPFLCQPWLQGSTRYVQLLRHKRTREQIQKDINSVSDE